MTMSPKATNEFEKRNEIQYTIGSVPQHVKNCTERNEITIILCT